MTPWVCENVSDLSARFRIKTENYLLKVKDGMLSSKVSEPHVCKNDFQYPGNGICFLFLIKLQCKLPKFK